MDRVEMAEDQYTRAIAAPGRGDFEVVTRGGGARVACNASASFDKVVCGGGHYAVDAVFVGSWAFDFDPGADAGQQAFGFKFHACLVVFGQNLGCVRFRFLTVRPGSSSSKLRKHGELRILLGIKG